MGDGTQALREPRSVSSESDIPETRSTPTAHPRLHTRQRVCKSSPYPPRDVEGTWEKWKGQNEHRP